MILTLEQIAKDGQNCCYLGSGFFYLNEVPAAYVSSAILNLKYKKSTVLNGKNPAGGNLCASFLIEEAVVDMDLAICLDDVLNQALWWCSVKPGKTLDIAWTGLDSTQAHKKHQVALSTTNQSGQQFLLEGTVQVERPNEPFHFIGYGMDGALRA